MKTLVVYDSAYGNTEKIARSIGDGIKGDVKVLQVNELNPSELESLDLIIVGSPTQGFRATKPIQAFIDSIPPDILKDTDIAAFDTRMPEKEVKMGLRLLMKVGGYAAPHIAEALKKKGGNQVIAPEGFFVNDKEGSLKEGEIERAATWGESFTK
ncbi:flavodoxin family protein [Chloroflexota bacterium]